MPRENVEIVKQLFFPAGTDYTDLFRDATAWEAAKRAREPLVDPDFKGGFVHSGIRAMEFKGLDGMRESFLEWLAPWVSYYDEIERLLPVGDDRVLVLGRQHGHLRDTEAEVVAETAAVYLVRNSKIFEIELYGDRNEALEAVGLSEQDAHADS